MLCGVTILNVGDVLLLSPPHAHEYGSSRGPEPIPVTYIRLPLRPSKPSYSIPLLEGPFVILVMADTPTSRTSVRPFGSMSKHTSHSIRHSYATDVGDRGTTALLKERTKCPYFRILIIGRANSGKTTILEKVCGVARGAARVTYDQDGVEIGAKSGKSGPRLLSRVRQKLVRRKSRAGASQPQVTPGPATSSIEVNQL